jgi:RNA polymerase sigma-70 factor (ECF subfamily)
VSGLDVQQLSDRYFTRIHRAALVLTGNPWDADDLAQETFLTITSRPGAFQGRSQPYTFLYGILLNLERRRVRRDGVRRRHLRVLWDREPLEERSSPAADAPVEVSEWKRSLWSEVARLPDGQRQALVLRFSEQLSYDEIALAMECPLGTAKTRVFHGLETLRQRLAGRGADFREVPDGVAEGWTNAG